MLTDLSAAMVIIPSPRGHRPIPWRRYLRSGGKAAGFGVVVAKNISQLPALLKAVTAEDAVPEAAKQMLAFLGAQVAQLDGRAETCSVCG